MTTRFPDGNRIDCSNRTLGTGPLRYGAFRGPLTFASSGLLILVSWFGCAPVAQAVEPPEPVRLFDGRSFAGWEGGTDKTWRVEKGAIVAGSLEKPASRNEFLCTRGEYGDFELRLKFKIVGRHRVNAGVQFRTRRIPGHHEVIGYQADIGPGYYGALYDESRRRKILAAPDRETVQRALSAVAKDGWHDYRIRAEGNHIQLWLNGVRTVDYREPDPKIARKGVIALQIHGGMRAVIAYKDIELIPLNDTK